MSYQAHQAALVARTILAMNRPLAGQEGAPRAVDMLRESTVRVWYDPVHRFDAGAAAAYRAIDDAGRFCWLVLGAGRRAQLSREANPFDAITEVNRGAAAADIPWDDVRQLARALRQGEIRLDLTRADFRDLPVAYRGLGRVGLSGWLAAWLMTVAPQLGAAIWAAHRRTLLSRRAVPTVFRAT